MYDDPRFCPLEDPCGGESKPVKRWSPLVPALQEARGAFRVRPFVSTENIKETEALGFL